MQTRRKRDKRARAVLAAHAANMQDEGFDPALRIVASAMTLGMPMWKSVILLYSVMGALLVDDTPEYAASRKEIIDYIRSGIRINENPIKTSKAEAEHGKA